MDTQSADPGRISPIDQRRVAQLLADAGVGWRDVEVVASTGSTNEDLLDRVATGAAREGAVLAAAEQTTGRGRLGRSWTSTMGTTLSFSVVLTPPRQMAPMVPLLTGVAVAEALRSLSPATAGEVGLKWPNDVLVGESKVAGILAESAGDAVVVGCGINVSMTADQLPVPTATSLGLAGIEVGRAELLVACVAQLHAAASRWREAGYNAEAAGLLAAYRNLCATIGSPVEVTLPDAGVVSGVAVGVDDEGHLLVDTDEGSRTLTAGDVVHVRGRVP